MNATHCALPQRKKWKFSAGELPASHDHQAESHKCAVFVGPKQLKSGIVMKLNLTSSPTRACCNPGLSDLVAVLFNPVLSWLLEFGFCCVCKSVSWWTCIYLGLFVYLLGMVSAFRNLSNLGISYSWKFQTGSFISTHTMISYFLKSFFLKDLFICFYFKGRVTEKGRERKSLFHPLVHSPECCNSRGWTGLKPGT